MDHYDDDYTTTRSTPVDVDAEAEPDDETPPERHSPSFSFHEERRLLKSDEYWLAHKIPRLPPPALGTSPSASIAALDGLSLSRYDERDDERRSMAAPDDYDPSGVTHHRERMDEDERLELEEEQREKMGGMAAGGLPPDQFDTGESPCCEPSSGCSRRVIVRHKIQLLLLFLLMEGEWCIAADHPPDHTHCSPSTSTLHSYPSSQARDHGADRGTSPRIRRVWCWQRTRGVIVSGQWRGWRSGD